MRHAAIWKRSIRNAGKEKEGDQQSNREERRCLRRCSTKLACTGEWRNGRTVKNSSRSIKEKWIFAGQEAGSQEASHGVVCSSEQISLHKKRKMNARGMWGIPRWLGKDSTHKLTRWSEGPQGGHGTTWYEELIHMARLWSGGGSVRVTRGAV